MHSCMLPSRELSGAEALTTASAEVITWLVFVKGEMQVLSADRGHRVRRTSYRVLHNRGLIRSSLFDSQASDHGPRDGDGSDEQMLSCR